MMNDAIVAVEGLPTVIGTTFSVEAGLVTARPFSGDYVTGVDDGRPAVAVTRDKNSGIAG
jgi:hypothetical protein